MPKQIILKHARDMIEINGSWYLPINPDTRVELEREIKEPYSKEKHQVQIEVSQSKTDKIYGAFWFEKKKAI